jgi:hypothetical protein
MRRLDEAIGRAEDVAEVSAGAAVEAKARAAIASALE